MTLFQVVNVFGLKSMIKVQLVLFHCSVWRALNFMIERGTGKLVISGYKRGASGEARAELWCSLGLTLGRQSLRVDQILLH